MSEDVNECLACGSERVDPNRVYYMVNPRYITTPSSYLLCDVHSHVKYNFDDIYTEDGKRKPINHEEIIKRMINDRT